jgi:AAA ATPase domain
VASEASRLVGREVELGRLADAVASARSGVRRVVLIQGDAGIGKSRLVAEALAAYREPADAVGTGYGVQLAGPEILYRVTTDALRTLCRDSGVDSIRAAAGPYAGALRPLHPGLASAGDEAVNPAAVLPAVLATVEQLATDRLVWLVFEDLPWVDASSRDLLAYLVRVAQRCRLLVLVTIRTHDPATDPAIGDLVDTWAAQPGVHRLALSPLTSEQVTELVIARLDGQAPEGQIDRIARVAQGKSAPHRATRGHPGATTSMRRLRVRWRSP